MVCICGHGTRIDSVEEGHLDDGRENEVYGPVLGLFVVSVSDPSNKQISSPLEYRRSMGVDSNFGCTRRKNAAFFTREHSSFNHPLQLLELTLGLVNKSMEPFTLTSEIFSAHYQAKGQLDGYRWPVSRFRFLQDHQSLFTADGCGSLFMIYGASILLTCICYM